MQSFALIVGISSFENGLVGLPYAEDDAYEMFQVLCEDLDIPDGNMELLLNKKEEEIFRSVDKMAEKCQKGDRVIVYIATHGKTLYESPFLAACDATIGESCKGWFRIHDIIFRFYNLGCSVLGFLDCCHSTMQPTRESQETAWQIPNNENQYNIILAAAGVDEEAHEDSEYGHGCWTYFLLEALKGKQPGAFDSGTKKITAESLQNYLYSKVNNRVKYKFNKVQRPHIWGARAGNVIICDYSLKEVPYMKVKDLYFGEIDTDSEMQSLPSREYLVRNFYDLNNITSQISSSNLYEMIIGNKGTGKTYIGEYLERTNNNVFYQSVGQIAWSDVKNLSFAGTDEKGKYCTAWKYIIYVIIGFRIIDLKIHGYEQIENLLRQIYKNNYNIVYRNPVGRKNILFKKEIKNGMRLEGYDSYAQENGIIPLGNICMLFEDIYIDIITGDKLVFLIDGLDEQLRGTVKDEQKKILLDLIYAMHDVNNTIQHMKIVLLFRNDILQVLNNEANLNKTITARSIILSWLSNNANEQLTPLYQFLNKRIETSAQCGDEKSLTLDQILPENIKGEKTWDWIMELTTYTPRDVIAFFNECKNVAGEEYAFNADDLWNATRKYSTYLWKEMTDVLSSSCLSGKEEALKLFLERLGTRRSGAEYGTVTYTDYYNEYSKDPQLSEISIDDLTKTLYESGILAIKTRYGRIYWHYREDPIEYNRDVFSQGSFQIHKGLWKMLHIW